MVWIEFRLVSGSNTVVLCHYNMHTRLQYTHIRHLIAHPRPWHMSVFLWLYLYSNYCSTLINIMPHWPILLGHLTVYDYSKWLPSNFWYKITLVGKTPADHSDVVGVLPVGAAPTTSQFFWGLAVHTIMSIKYVPVFGGFLLSIFQGYITGAKTTKCMKHILWHISKCSWLCNIYHWFNVFNPQCSAEFLWWSNVYFIIFVERIYHWHVIWT